MRGGRSHARLAALRRRGAGRCAAGRVVVKRASGSKLLFYDLTGDGKKLQIMADLG